MNNQFLNQLLIQQTSKECLCLNRIIINIMIPLSHIQLKKIILQIGNYINSFKIYSLSINSINHSNIIYSDNKITPLLFYLLPQITYNKTLKEIIIFNPIDEAILGLRFMNLLKYSSLNLIIIKSFNIRLNKQQPNIWQLNLITPGSGLSYNVTSKLEKIKEIIQLRKRKAAETVTSEQSLKELNPSKIQKLKHSHKQPLLITWHTTKRTRADSFRESNPNEIIEAKMRKMSLSSSYIIKINNEEMKPASTLQYFSHSLNTSKSKSGEKRKRTIDSICEDISLLSIS